MTNNLLKLFKRNSRSSEANFKREAMVKQAGDQFKKMVERGLDLPVVLL